MKAIDRVDIAASTSNFKNMKRLIMAFLGEGAFVNALTKTPYSYSRVDQMLREDKEWVADKLIKFAEKHPRE